jgi:hypothetical protein
LNGSWPGAAIHNFTDGTTKATAILEVKYGPSAAILCLSHNEGTVTGQPYLSLWDGWISLVRSRLPYLPLSLMTQNPKDPSLTYNVEAHELRLRELLSYAAMNGYGMIDVREAFADAIAGGTALSTLVDPADGIHPTDAAGSPLWAQAVESAFSAAMRTAQ